MAEMLRKAAIRHERNVRGLPGTPDFVVKGRRVAIFVDGLFFHGYNIEKYRHKLKPFWINKITNNMRRDRRVNRVLRSMGWSVIRIREDQLRNEDRCITRIKRMIKKRETCD